MPRTTKRPQPAEDATNGVVPEASVLTLSQVAAYLQVTESEVLHAVEHQGLPARKVGTEWRFLRAAVDDWFRSATPAVESNKEAWMALAGVWKDDPQAEEELKEIHRRRGRAAREEAE